MPPKTMPAPDPAPAHPASQRILSIDIIRGLALFGILVVNITTFRSPNYPAYRGFEHAVDWLILVLFQGKFLSLYALLFGLGFALFMKDTPDRSTLWRFAWRSLLLLAIGALHFIFLWEGDILMQYALAAFLLLPFARRKSRTALGWGVGLYAFYALFLLAIVVASASRPQTPVASEASVDPSSMPAALAQTGSYMALVQWRLGSVGAFLGEHIFASLLLVGIFLIGAYAGREGLLADPAAHSGLLKRVLAWGLPVGLVFSLLSATLVPGQKSLPVPERAVVIVLAALAPLILALAYAAGAALLASRVRWLKPLAAAGRMSLSNYLLQSLVLTFIFYHYGLKLFDRVSPLVGFLLAVLIYALQLLLSNLWFRRFRYGPAEWAWRCLTYGKWIRITQTPVTLAEIEVVNI